jgi:hypothetical protein
MPVAFHIDHDKRLVSAAASGHLTTQEFLAYHEQVWACTDVAGFNEYVDMTAVQSIESAAPERVRHLAAISAATDSPTMPSRMAFFAPDPLSFGMARMYATYRNLEERSTKEVGVFHTETEARAFLEACPGKD